jgi:hypothetical protein
MYRPGMSCGAGNHVVRFRVVCAKLCVSNAGCVRSAVRAGSMDSVGDTGSVGDG